MNLRKDATQNNWRKEWREITSLFSDNLLAVSIMRALPLLSPLLSGHQALDTPSLASFQKHDEGIQSEIEVDDRLWTGNASFVARLFQNGDVSAKEYANL